MTVQRASTAIFLLFVGAMCIAGFRVPTYNWDILGYMGAAIAWDASDGGTIHARVYETARAQIPPAAFSTLTDGSSDALERDYRQDLYTSPAHFVQQLPYYQVRPAYVALIYLLGHGGVELVTAVRLLSVASYAGIALLAFVWLARHLAVPFAALAAALLALSPPMITVLRLASPDALSALMLVGGFFLLLEFDRARAAVGILMAAMLVRSDNVVLLLMFLGMLAFTPSAGLARVRLAALCVAAIGGYLLISSMAGHYGWGTLFYHSFVALVPDPATRTVSVDPGSYVLALVRGIRTALDGSALSFALIGVFAYALPRGEATSMLDRVLLLLAGNVALRYALFPAVWDRFLVAHYVVAAVILVMKGARYARRPSVAATADPGNRPVRRHAT